MGCLNGAIRGAIMAIKFNPLIYIAGVPIAIILGGTEAGPVVNLSLIAIFVGMITDTIATNISSSSSSATSTTLPASTTVPTSTYEGQSITKINLGLANWGAGVVDWLKKHI